MTDHLFPNIPLDDNLILSLRVLADARPGSEPLSEKLGGLLEVDPKGFQVVDTCERFTLRSGFSFDRDLGRLARDWKDGHVSGKRVRG